MPEKDKSEKELDELHVPRKLFRLYAMATMILIPWTILLSITLPSDHLDRRWDLAWTGFDIGLIVALALTAYWGLRKSGWVIVAASATGTFLLIDAWFDCVTSRIGLDYVVSIVTALCFEIPAALVSYWIAFETGRRYFNKV